MTVYQATEWSQVEKITSLKPVICIRPTGANWVRAKQTWDDFQATDDIRYYLKDSGGEWPSGGYVRLLRVSLSRGMVPTWIVDYASPSKLEMLVEIAAVLDGTLLVKKWFSNQDIGANWPSIAVAFPKLAKFPYTYTSASEAEWRVVLKDAV